MANIVAILIVFAACFFFFIILIAIGSMGQNGVKVKKNSVLTLDFKTNIIDSPTEGEDNVFSLDEENDNVLLYDVLQAIEKAKNDDNIKGISIETDNISAGLTQLDDIRVALQDFKKSGKFVLAYGNVVSQPAYYLGSVADKYYLNPAGGIDLKGLSSEILFYKDFIDKYGIGVHVIRHGKYKSAVEPYLRNDLSPENKEQLSTILNDIWSNISGKMAISRKIDTADFKTVVDSLYGMLPDNSVKYRLADQLLQKSQYDQVIKGKLKLGQEDKLNKISFYNYINSDQDKKSSNNEVAILYASGTIISGKGYEDIHSLNMMKQIKKLAEDDDVKAVVFRVNSPGGSANASDEILFELSQLKKKKPVVVSFGDYAASGGYYISMAGDKIFSEPNTLTGSIGVFGVAYYFKDLANKNGIHSDIVSTNTNSRYYSPINGVPANANAVLTKSVEATYKRFVYFVTQNRKKSFEQIDQVGGGRVWSGTRAKAIGLVDELGSIDDAVKYAAQKAGIKDYSTESYPKKKTIFERIFSNMEEDELSTRMIKNKIGKENYRLFESIVSKKLDNGVVMEMPYSITFK